MSNGGGGGGGGMSAVVRGSTTLVVAGGGGGSVPKPTLASAVTVVVTAPTAARPVAVRPTTRVVARPAVPVARLASRLAPESLSPRRELQDRPGPAARATVPGRRRRWWRGLRWWRRWRLGEWHWFQQRRWWWRLRLGSRGDGVREWCPGGRRQRRDHLGPRRRWLHCAGDPGVGRAERTDVHRLISDQHAMSSRGGRVTRPHPDSVAMSTEPARTRCPEWDSNPHAPKGGRF